MLDSIGTCLVVDDVRAVRRQVSSWMSDIGFRSLEAMDGDSAWSLIQNHDIDLLVTDIDMPRTSGLDLLRLVRTSDSESYRRLPTLVISSLSDREIESIVREHQADTFVLKPLSKNSFVDAAFRTLRRSPAWQSFKSYIEGSPHVSPKLRELHRRAKALT
ncbi:MAG: response regulator [Planctomycetota bacterium]